MKRALLAGAALLAAALLPGASQAQDTFKVGMIISLGLWRPRHREGARERPPVSGA